MIIGLDVGGTHTDVVLLGRQGLINAAKIPTDTTHLFETVVNSLDTVTKGVDPAHIQRLVLSTTLTTNAIVEDQLPLVGMIVTAGPGQDPELFATPGPFWVADGALDHRGRELSPIHAAQIRAFADDLKKEGIRHVGVVGKFSVRNPAHEIEIARLLEGVFDKVFLGHTGAGALNFPRRIATTYLNAAVYGLHLDFFNAVRKSLAQKGFGMPMRILKADGGNMNLEASVGCPAYTIKSGPAASVMGCLALASSSEETLVLDIGGTTTDMAILVGDAPLLNPLGITIGDYQTLIRSLETHSFGLGGDSEIRLEQGTLIIGPRRRGPALALGGPVPTPTDALVILDQYRVGDRGRAEAGFRELAAGLGLDLRQTAQKVMDIACCRILEEAARMVRRINAKPVYTVHELLEGHQVKPKRILVMGGPAEHFTKALAGLADIPVTVVPRNGVANAIGAALARTTCQVTVFADTQQGRAVAPEENFGADVGSDFNRDKALALAFDLLKAKAVKMGANPDGLEMEVTESLQFNMVRGFYTTGKNIRISTQVKPGLIQGYRI